MEGRPIEDQTEQTYANFVARKKKTCCNDSNLNLYVKHVHRRHLQRTGEHDLNAFELSFRFQTLILYVLCELDFMCY